LLVCYSGGVKLVVWGYDILYKLNWRMKTSSSLKQQVTFENESTKDVVLH